jgi:hypothetical protein
VGHQATVFDRYALSTTTHIAADPLLVYAQFVLTTDVVV